MSFLIRWFQLLLAFGITVCFFLPWMENSFTTAFMGRMGNTMSGFDIFMQAFCNPQLSRCAENHEYLWWVIIGPALIVFGVFFFARFGMPLWYRAPSVVANGFAPASFALPFVEGDPTTTGSGPQQTLTIWLMVLLACCVVFLFIPRQDKKTKRKRKAKRA